jgi:hypothetical protein
MFLDTEGGKFFPAVQERRLSFRLCRKRPFSGCLYFEICRFLFYPPKFGTVENKNEPVIRRRDQTKPALRL